MDDFNAKMREFIMATEMLTHHDVPAPLVEEEPVSSSEPSLLEDLDEVVFKLRAFMESSGGEFAYGVELGMQRAADMIERVIKRHGG